MEGALLAEEGLPKAGEPLRMIILTKVDDDRE
jgi:hypothetical protein